MMVPRRQVLKSAAAAGLVFVRPALASQDRSYRLEVRTGTAGLLEEGGPKTPIWGFDGVVPGPEIRARRGQPLRIEVTNRLEQPTAVHWHGIRIDNAMDGVPGLTQDPIAPGETFVYDFTPPDAGTFWYHSHHKGWEQQARGLYGPLIVEEDTPVAIDRDLTIVADDWRLTNEGALHEESFGNVGEWAHAGRLGNVLTLNGKPYEKLQVATGERVRLRLINACNARVLTFRLAGAQPWLAALDGQPVAAVKLDDAPVRLAPAQRVDLVFDVTAAGGSELAIMEVSGQEGFVAGYLQVVEPEMVGRPVREGTPVLPPNAVPVPDRARSRIVDLDMAGGAMRFLASATYQGKQVDGRTLAMQHGQVWAFNGVAGIPEQPLFIAAHNEHVIIRMRNDTLWPHAMHIHGFHFIEMSRKAPGKLDFSSPGRHPPGAVPLRDTVLLEAGEDVEVGFVADNPGRWLLHCHMAEHMAGGMVTWFEVR